MITWLFHATAWRVRKLLGDRRVDDFLVNLARRWRPVLRKPVFIGIAGSGGKTTAKDLLHGILSGTLHGVASPGTLNVPPEVAKTVLRVRPNQAYCIAELCEHLPGVMDTNLALFQPGIAIVTVVKDDHLAAFESRDALAAEIAKLVHNLPVSGTAVLNADEPQVLAMATHCQAKVLTYGLAPEADVRAEDVSAAWPDRLRMTLVYRDQHVHVQTQLCGAHWLPSVLGAVGGGLAAGLTLAECAKGLEGVEPFEGRMQPVTTPEGVTFIRDDFKAPLWTIDSCLDFLGKANAKRKILVVGEISEIASQKAKRYAQVGRRARLVSDMTIFIGPWATGALASSNTSSGGAMRIFAHVRDAADFLNYFLQAGDLILLKGNAKQDHLYRLVLARTSQIACWRDDCQRIEFCSACPKRMVPSGPPSLAAPSDSVADQREQARNGGGSDSAIIEPDGQRQYIVGLGNPGAQFDNTPHNIGYAAVDAFALAWQLAWQRAPEGWLALGLVQGRPVALVKLDSVMNLTGIRLRHLADRLQFTPAHCILVFDDLDLPVGAVRSKVRSSAGGHRGVASILEAFQTDAFRRVKLGVAPSEPGVNWVEYVLRPFDPNAHPLAIQSLAQASALVDQFLGLTSPANRTKRPPIT